MLYSTEDFYRSSITSAVSARRFGDATRTCNAIKVSTSRNLSLSRVIKQSKKFKFLLTILQEIISHTFDDCSEISSTSSHLAVIQSEHRPPFRSHDRIRLT